MKGFSLIAAGAIACSLGASPAFAASRTFVSGTGSDTGNCGLAAPCRTFAYALTQTSPSGEIIVLSSAGYGSVIINQSVSIINTSNFAGVTATSGIGITINAGPNDDVVTLRGLTIDGGGTGNDGILMNSVGTLIVDQCNVMNFAGSSQSGNGIFVEPSSGTHNILVTNTVVSNNTFVGLYILPQGGATTNVVIDRVTANNNGYGVAINNSLSSGGTTKAGLSNSTASFNTINGFLFENVNEASLDALNATNNTSSGVYTVASSLYLGRTVLMNNGGYGLESGSSGTVNTYGDNRIGSNVLGRTAFPAGTDSSTSAPFF